MPSWVGSRMRRTAWRPTTSPWSRVRSSRAGWTCPPTSARPGTTQPTQSPKPAGGTDVRSLIGGILDRAPVPYTTGRQNAFTTPGSGGGGRTAQLAAMGATGTLHAIVSSLAYDTAAVDWHLYRTPAPGTPDGQREEVTRHLALDVWNKPNSFFHRQLFVETFQQHLDLPGEAYWVVVKAGSIPLELWPVRPDRMEPVPSVKDYLKGWVYTGPGGEKVPLDLDEVIQLRLPDPMDPYRGLGPVGTILADIDSARLGAEWHRSFFLNSPQPRPIIQV